MLYKHITRNNNTKQHTLNINLNLKKTHFFRTPPFNPKNQKI